MSWCPEKPSENTTPFVFDVDSPSIIKNFFIRTSKGISKRLQEQADKERLSVNQKLNDNAFKRDEFTIYGV